MTDRAVILESEAIRLVSLPAVGARVVSLADRRTGREWLVPARQDADASVQQQWAAADAAFDGRAATGWDECLPSVAPAADPTGLALRLRDHGDAWGRPAAVALDARSRTGRSLTSVTGGLHWPYRFERRLQLDGDVLDAVYEIRNEGPGELPFLWSMHPLLDLPAGSRIHLPGTDEVAVSHAAGVRLRGSTDALRSGHAADLVRASSDGLAWPVADLPDGPFALDRTLDHGAGIALKLYAAAPPGGRVAAEAPDGHWLGFAWEPTQVPFVGLWLDYGGWPAENPVQQVAIEPTTAPADDLPTALALGRGLQVAAGGRVSWAVRLQLGHDRASLARFMAA